MRRCSHNFQPPSPTPKYRFARERCWGWELGVGSCDVCVVPCAFEGISGRSICPTRRSFTGAPLPAAELAVGTVTVRVVREAIGNNVTGQDCACDGGRDGPQRTHRRAGEERSLRA